MHGWLGMFCTHATETYTESLLKYTSGKRTFGIPRRKKDE